MAYDAAAGELRPFQEVMFRRRRHGIEQATQDVPVGLFCFELLYADGEDFTDRPYPERRAALAEALTLSDRLQLTTTLQVSEPEALDAAFTQAVADGCEGLVCKATGPDSGYRAGARGWSWIKLKRDYRTELADTVDLVVVGAYAGRGRRTGSYGAVLLAAYDPETETYRTVGRCGAGFTDADLAVLPERLAPLIRSERPPRVDSRVPADLWWSQAWCSRCSAPSSPSRRTTPRAGVSCRPTPGWPCGSPRFTGRWRDDKEPQDATTTGQLVDLFRTARHLSVPDS